MNEIQVYEKEVAIRKINIKQNKLPEKILNNNLKKMGRSKKVYLKSA